MSWLHRTKGRLAGAAVLTVSIVMAASSCTTNFDGVISGGGGGNGSDFLQTGRTLSFFTAFQIDPQSEDSAGPQFVVADDLNDDGVPDLVTAWNQSQPVQIHLQHRDTSGTISFETLILAGSIPVVSVAGLATADFDRDGHTDIAVLIKESLLEGAGCLDSEQPEGGVAGLILLYMGPDDPAQTNQALAWKELRVEASFLQGTAASDETPEIGGFSDMTLADMDGDNDMDIVVGWNSTCADGVNDAVIFVNNGPGAVRDGAWNGIRIPDTIPKNNSLIKSVGVADVDRDGDLDVVATFPTARTMNVRWYRNPTIDLLDDYHITDGNWQVGVVGQIATGADGITVGDVDRDGIVDVVVRSVSGGLVQWLKGPDGPTTAPLRAMPWQVYTLAEFPQRRPETIALGDLNSDGQLELIVGAQGALAWFDSQAAPTVYDQWIEHLVVDESPDQPSADIAATTDPNVDPNEVPGATVMNSILVADLDNDGADDILVTLDRGGLSGLTNDAIAWFRNFSTQAP